MTRSPLAPAGFPDLPAIPGVTIRTARAHYKTWYRCDLTFVTLDEGTTVAGVTTTSKCPSPEVEWCRDALVLGRARALVVNAGTATPSPAIAAARRSRQSPPASRRISAASHPMCSSPRPA